MSITNNVNKDSLLSARVRVPDGVVYRAFVRETVILNLETGLYHGVNTTGGKMLDTLVKSTSVQAAAEVLVGEFGRARDEIEADLCEFCEALMSRGLLAVDAVA